MDQKMYMKLKDEAQKRYQSDLAAIERVWDLSQQAGNGNGAAPKNTGRTRAGASSDTIRSIVDTMAGEFSFKDVEKALKETSPDKGIGPRYVVTFLKRLEQRKYIEVVKRGGPNKGPTVYKKKH
jgi:hypothetical protein